LQSEGFHIVDFVGGPEESFGNVLLTFKHSVRVTIVRDRGQWMADIASSADGETHGLHVLITAITGAEPDPCPSGELLRELPGQQPSGVRWNTEVPRIGRWLESGDRSDEIAEADRRWRRALRAYFKSLE
jgi:hypothetical protein